MNLFNRFAELMAKRSIFFAECIFPINQERDKIEVVPIEIIPIKFNKNAAKLQYLYAMNYHLCQSFILFLGIYRVK